MAYALHHRAEKQKIANAAHYQKNKDQYLENVYQRRRQLAEFIACQKKKCALCPETFRRCLEFHHVNGKEFVISRAIQRGMSLSRIQTEIDKCIVLCANCHRKETYKDEYLQSVS